MILLAAFKRRRYSLLYLGQIASHLGTHIYQVALAWWVLQKTGSATAVGGVLIASFVPPAILVLAGGVLADRMPRIPLMLVSDCARFALMIVMAALATQGALTIWLALVISALVGIADAFFWPAYKSIFPELVPQSELASANSLEVLGSQGVHILAPAIGAALIAANTIPLAFALNGVSFALSAVSLVAMLMVPAEMSSAARVAAGAAPVSLGVSRFSDALAPEPGIMPEVAPLAPMAHAKPSDFWRELREGMAVARALPWVLVTIALVGLSNLAFEGATQVALPYYVQHTLAGSPLLYGGLLAAAAVGGVPAALWFGSRTVRQRGLVMYTGFALAMLATSVVGLVHWPPLMLAAMFVEGLALTLFDLSWSTAMQQYIPLEKLGRVSSIDQLGQYITLPLSYGLTGLIVDRLGAAPFLVWGCVFAAVIVSLGFLSRSVRTLD